MIDCEFECDPSGPNNDVHADRCPIALESRIAHLESLTASAVAKEAARWRSDVGRIYKRLGERHRDEPTGCACGGGQRCWLRGVCDEMQDILYWPVGADWLAQHDAEIVKPWREAIEEVRDDKENEASIRIWAKHLISSLSVAPAVGPDESRL